jgi:hypothetical protein
MRELPSLAPLLCGLLAFPGLHCVRRAGCWVGSCVLRRKYCRCNRCTALVSSPQAVSLRHPVSGPANESALQLLLLPAVLKGVDDLKAKGFRVDQMQVLMLAGMPLSTLGLPFLSRTAPSTHLADCIAGSAPTQPATTLHCVLYRMCSAEVPRYVPHCTALPCRTRS